MIGADPAEQTTPPQAVFRRSAKVLVVDTSGAVLLFRGRDPHRPEDGGWWFPPGGGVEDGESDEQAALRELKEETGLVIPTVGPEVATRRAMFPFEGQLLDSDEVYFVVRVDRFEPDVTGWTATERRSILEHRWWSMDELEATAEVIYPDGLLVILRARMLLGEEPPNYD